MRSNESGFDGEAYNPAEDEARWEAYLALMRRTGEIQVLPGLEDAAPDDSWRPKPPVAIDADRGETKVSAEVEPSTEHPSYAPPFEVAASDVESVAGDLGLAARQPRIGPRGRTSLIAGTAALIALLVLAAANVLGPRRDLRSPASPAPTAPRTSARVSRGRPPNRPFADVGAGVGDHHRHLGVGRARPRSCPPAPGSSSSWSGAPPAAPWRPGPRRSPASAASRSVVLDHLGDQAEPAVGRRRSRAAGSSSAPVEPMARGKQPGAALVGQQAGLVGGVAQLGAGGRRSGSRRPAPAPGRRPPHSRGSSPPTACRAGAAPAPPPACRRASRGHGPSARAHLAARARRRPRRYRRRCRRPAPGAGHDHQARRSSSSR
jgi:hypothetical protein